MQTINIGKGIDMEVPEMADLPEAARLHAYRIGMRNILMDSHAGITAEKANGGDIQAMSRAVAEKKLAALVAGEVRVASTREGDPIKREAIRLALVDIDAALAKKGRKAEAKAKREKALELIATRDKYMVQARKNVEAAKAIDIDDIDL